MHYGVTFDYPLVSFYNAITIKGDHLGFSPYFIREWPVPIYLITQHGLTNAR